MHSIYAFDSYHPKCRIFIHVTFGHSTYGLASQCMEIILNLESIIQHFLISFCFLMCKFEKHEFCFVEIKGKLLMGEG